MDTSPPTISSRILGCFLGGAVGDALGAPVEFASLGEIRRLHGLDGVTGYVGSEGRFTDDTQMTLFTAEGLIRGRQRWTDRGISNPVSVVRRAYLRWLRTQGEGVDQELDWSQPGWLVSEPILNQRRAPGNTCLSALRSGEMGTPDRPLNDSYGCGGVMRIAPVGFVWDDAFDMGCKLAAITHGHPAGYLSAGAMTQVIADISRGTPIREAVETVLERLRATSRSSEVTEALEEALRAVDSGPPGAEIVEDLGGGWYGYDALAISVYAALTAADFRSGALLAVNHSGDSDSTGSITGQLLGAIHGVEAIPGEWLDQLEGRGVIERLAGDFADCFVDGTVLDYFDYPPN
jgi:ADP-ribosylglycohydrolase